MAVRQLLTAFVAFTTLHSANGIPTRSPLNQRDDSYEVGYINVSVSTLWTNSGKPRAVDAPAISSPVEIQQWLDAMTEDEFRDLTDSSRTQTQSLYGSRVYILDKTSEDGWYQIALPDQPTPKEELGYPAWVPSSQVFIEKGHRYGALQEHRPFAQVTGGQTVALYKDSKLSKKVLDISFDTRLPVVSRHGKAVRVAVPGSSDAYLSASDVTIYGEREDIPKPTGSDLVETGKGFIGRPYLWGGASGWAVDCSGFTHTVYDSHGITIPRDSGPQAYMEGYGQTPVEKADLVAGDLIFYASNLTNPKSIYHVAMYAGEGNMLESYKAGVPVRLTTARFDDNYWGAVRIIH